MGARLAVDKLGRLAPGKKKARNWLGEAGEPQVGSDPSAPGTQTEPSAPHGGKETVRIKTRGAVHDVPTVEYGRADLSRADQPMVKTKDAYIHRQAVAQNRQYRGTAPQAKEHIWVDQSTPGQPTIRTKGSDVRQYGIGSEKVGRELYLGRFPKILRPTRPRRWNGAGRDLYGSGHIRWRCNGRKVRAWAEWSQRRLSGKVPPACILRLRSLGLPVPRRSLPQKLCGKPVPMVRGPSKQPTRNVFLLGSPSVKKSNRQWVPPGRQPKRRIVLPVRPGRSPAPTSKPVNRPCRPQVERNGQRQPWTGPWPELLCRPCVGPCQPSGPPWSLWPLAAGR